MSKLKLLLVHDKTIERLGNQYILGLSKEVESIEIAKNHDEAIEKAEQYNPDIIIMDVKIRGKDGVETAQELKLRNIPAKIIMLSNPNDEGYELLASLAARVEGFTVKTPYPEELSGFIKIILGYEIWFDSKIAVAVLDYVNKTTESSEKVLLTATDKEILNLIANEFKPADIVLKMGVDEITLKANLESLRNRLYESHMAKEAQAKLK